MSSSPPRPAPTRRLERQYNLRAKRIEIDFYGPCPACSEPGAAESRRSEFDTT
ncbi:MAG: hypothetical protein V3R91_08400 [Myxococcota bacterium]